MLSVPDGKPMLRQGDTGDWIGTFEGHQGAVWGVALNKDATLAASGAADFTGKLWNAISGEELYSFKHNHIVKSAHFSTDSKTILFGSNEKTIKIFDLNQPDKCTFLIRYFGTFFLFSKLDVTSYDIVSRLQSVKKLDSEILH